MVTTAVAPDAAQILRQAQRAWLRDLALARFAANLLATSQIWPTPVAPTGCPLDFNPPLVFIGRSPLRRVHPSSAYGPPSPFLTNPRSSVAMISAMVKQSCSSANWMSCGGDARHLVRFFAAACSRRGKW